MRTTATTATPTTTAPNGDHAMSTTTAPAAPTTAAALVVTITRRHAAILTDAAAAGDLTPHGATWSSTMLTLPTTDAAAAVGWYVGAALAADGGVALVNLAARLTAAGVPLHAAPAADVDAAPTDAAPTVTTDGTAVTVTYVTPRSMVRRTVRFPDAAAPLSILTDADHADLLGMARGALGKAGAARAGDFYGDALVRMARDVTAYLKGGGGLTGAARILFDLSGPDRGHAVKTFGTLVADLANNAMRRETTDNADRHARHKAARAAAILADGRITKTNPDAAYGYVKGTEGCAYPRERTTTAAGHNRNLPHAKGRTVLPREQSLSTMLDSDMRLRRSFTPSDVTATAALSGDLAAMLDGLAPATFRGGQSDAIAAAVAASGRTFGAILADAYAVTAERSRGVDPDADESTLTAAALRKRRTSEHSRIMWREVARTLNLADTDGMTKALQKAARRAIDPDGTVVVTDGSGVVPTGYLSGQVSAMA